MLLRDPTDGLNLLLPKQSKVADKGTGSGNLEAEVTVHITSSKSILMLWLA